MPGCRDPGCGEVVTFLPLRGGDNRYPSCDEHAAGLGYRPDERNGPLRDTPRARALYDVADSEEP